MAHDFNTDNVNPYKPHDQALLEAIFQRGFTIIPDLVASGDLDSWREKIDNVYAKQESEFGRHALENIQDLNVCRAPILYDFSFLQLAAHKTILAIIRSILGDWFILNLQNAILIRPGHSHHQSQWHRDLPHQQFVTSRPLAVSVLIAIDDFSPETGGTHLLAFSHKREALSETKDIQDNCIIPSVRAGSAIVFDAMLFHRAGRNSSTHVRRAVNHMYTIPIIKQQYDFPRALGENIPLDFGMHRLLGYTSLVHLNDKAWRHARINRSKLSR